MNFSILIDVKSLFLFYFSLFIAIKSTYTQQYTYPLDEHIFIQDKNIVSSLPAVNIDFKIKNCPSADRKFLIGLTFINPENSVQLIQTLTQNQIQLKIISGNNIYLNIAEICIKQFYVHSESIDTTNKQNTFTYKSKPQGYNNNMKAIAYIIGFEFPSGEKNIKLFIENIDSQPDGFLFTFTNSNANNLKRIDINYLYYEDNALNNNYFKPLQYIDKKFKQLNPPLQDKFQSGISSFQVDYQCPTPNHQDCKVLSGYNGSDLNNDDGGGFILTMQTTVNFSTQSFDINYTGESLKLNGIISQLIVFQIRRCNFDSNSKTQINSKEQCIEKCIDGEYQENDAKRKIIVCKQCNQTCKTCLNQFECLSCNQNKYLFKKQCYDQKPQDGFCFKK